MDADYRRNLDREGSPTKAFESSLFVWATVMSRPAQDRAIVDAGLKALAFHSGPPLVCDEPAASYERASDERGRPGISGATNRVEQLRPGFSEKMDASPALCGDKMTVCCRAEHQMKGIAFTAWFAAAVCGLLGGCAAKSSNAQGKAAAPIGSWKGSVFAVDLGSDGRASYKNPGTADLIGRWEWLPTTEAGGILVLTASAPSLVNRLQFPITWRNRNELRFCDANDHCDTLSRQ